MGIPTFSTIYSRLAAIMISWLLVWRFAAWYFEHTHQYDSLPMIEQLGLYQLPLAIGIYALLDYGLAQRRTVKPIYVVLLGSVLLAILFVPLLITTYMLATYINS